MKTEVLAIDDCPTWERAGDQLVEATGSREH